MSQSSKAKPKFKDIDPAEFWDTRILDYFESAQSCFVVLHPFYKLTLTNYALLEEDEVQLLHDKDQELADKVKWNSVMQECGVVEYSDLRALILSEIYGFNQTSRQKEFSTYLKTNFLCCPQSNVTPITYQKVFHDEIRSTGGEEKALENTNIKYSSNGDIVVFCPREEVCTYLAGEQHIIEAVVTNRLLEGFWAGTEIKFNW